MSRRPHPSDAELLDVRRGERALASWKAALVLRPEERNALVSAILSAGARPARTVEPWRVPWKWAAAATLATAAALAWWAFWGPGAQGRLRLAWDRGEWSSFETLAAEIHQASVAEPGLRFASSDPAAVREWLREHTGVVAKLALERAADDGDAFELRGATTVEGDGHPVGVVAYRVDGRPVTLLVARSSDQPGAAPAWRPWRKALRGRELADGGRLLTWNSSGTVYSLAVDEGLPLRRACFVCHTTPERRRLIEGADLH